MRLEQASEVLRDAKLLLNAGGSGRTIINRAYYAMFYAVLALLQKIGKTPRRHRGAISLFDTEFVKKGIFTREDSISPHTVFDLRQEADYRTLKPIALEKSGQILQSSLAFVKKVREYLTTETSDNSSHYVSH